MKIYEYAIVDWTDRQYVALSSTDLQLLEWTRTEIKKFVPNYKLSYTREDVSNKTYKWSLEHMKDRDQDVAWWIIRQLCHRGWEPLGGGRFRLEKEIDET